MHIHITATFTSRELEIFILQFLMTVGQELFIRMEGVSKGSNNNRGIDSQGLSSNRGEAPSTMGETYGHSSHSSPLSVQLSSIKFLFLWTSMGQYPMTVSDDYSPTELF